MPKYRKFHVGRDIIVRNKILQPEVFAKFQIACDELKHELGYSTEVPDIVITLCYHPTTRPKYEGQDGVIKANHDRIWRKDEKKKLMRDASKFNLYSVDELSKMVKEINQYYKYSAELQQINEDMLVQLRENFVELQNQEHYIQENREFIETFNNEKHEIEEYISSLKQENNDYKIHISKLHDWIFKIKNKMKAYKDSNKNLKENIIVMQENMEKFFSTILTRLLTYSNVTQMKKEESIPMKTPTSIGNEVKVNQPVNLMPAFSDYFPKKSKQETQGNNSDSETDEELSTKLLAKFKNHKQKDDSKLVNVNDDDNSDLDANDLFGEYEDEND